MKRKLFYTLLVFVCIIGVLFFYTKPKDTIAIIGAMDDEISEIRDNLKNSNIIKKNDFIITKGTLENINITRI